MKPWKTSSKILSIFMPHKKVVFGDGKLFYFFYFIIFYFMFFYFKRIIW